MIKGLCLLNLVLILYHGYVYLRLTDGVPHETLLNIVVAVLLVGFVLKEKDDESNRGSSEV